MRRQIAGQAGMSLIEVLLAVAFLAVALVALLSMLTQGSVSVVAGGGQSKATNYARQQIEMLKNHNASPPANTMSVRNARSILNCMGVPNWTAVIVAACRCGDRLQPVQAG